jgi:cysteinyl-tRNA synthetase
MSKSLGNFYTLRDLLKKGLKPKALRYVLLSTHYRQQLNFTIESAKAAENSVQRLLDFMKKLDEANGSGIDVKKQIDKLKKEFEKAMDNNLETSQALAAVFDFVKEINRKMDQLSKANAKDVKKAMLDLDKVLGILEIEEEVLEKDIEKLIQDREKARKDKDFKTADKIRDNLNKKGIVLEDTPKGVRWKRV